MDYDSFDVAYTEESESEKTPLVTPSMLDAYNAREIRRLKNSASFRIGRILTSAIIRPWKIIILPIEIFYLIYCIGMERLGKRAVPYEGRTQETLARKTSDCVLFFPTNGVGFGHFTRMYALAKRWRDQSPATEIIFFTTMPTLHLLYSENFLTYHISGRKKYKDITASQWNAMVEEQLSLIFSQHRPSTFVFDGAYPYRGMLNAIRDVNGMQKVWMRRGMFKKGSNIPIDSIQHFDLIIRPEDSTPMKPSEIDHSVETLVVPPIILLDRKDLMPKEQARIRLGLPIDGKVAYVQLGAGRINDIESEVRLAVNALRSRDVIVVLGESMLGERLSIDIEGVILLRDYPNSMYFNAFDASVQAGGYNSYHEVRKFGIPTAFFPNMKTGMDDQLARCKQAEEEGWGIVVQNRTKQTIQKAVDQILVMEKRTPIEEMNGALELFKQLDSRGHV